MKKTWLAVLAITLIAFALRAYRLDFVSLRGDEAFTVIFVQRTWDALWKGIRLIEPNPPLMYLALRAWVALAGASEFATRYFSVLFGVLCVPLLYRLVREMFSGKGTRAVAPFATVLLAINPYQIWHSQDVRNYTMWPALGLVALILFWRWWRLEVGKSSYEPRITNLAFYVLATTASLYTHYYDTFILVAENIFVFTFFWRRRETLARWIGAQAVLALVYLPWVLFFTNRVTTYGEASAEQGVSLLDVFSRTLATFTLSDTVPEILKTLLWLLLTLALCAILIYLARHERTQAAFLFLYIAVPTLALYAVSIGRPLFGERYLNGIAPAYYLVFAVGLAALWRVKVRWRPAALAIAMLFFGSSSAYALANYYFDPAYAKAPDWRALMQFIVARQQPGDIVVQNFTDDSISYYRNRLSRKNTPPTQPGCDNQEGYLPVITLPKDYWAKTGDEKVLQELNTTCRRIWFIPAAPDFWDPDQFVEKYLSRYDDREIDTRIGTVRLQLYLTPREFEPKIIPLNAQIGNATLVGYRVQGTRALHVVLYWRAAQKIERDFTVFVHLADATDRVIAQQDTAPVRGTYPTSQWRSDELIVDAYDLQVDAAPGTYALIVGLYDPATLARVPALNVKGVRLPNDRVWLTQVTIPQ
jgi:4-amino-4-deoxy-L-arabinose transferase-like glycosyltransferase